VCRAFSLSRASPTAIGVHALADGNVEEDEIEHPADAVDDSKNV